MDNDCQRTVTVRVPEGLHARPAAQLVACARQFTAAIDITNGTKTASARSAVKLLLLSVKEHDRLTVRASGPDASAAVDAISQLLENPAAAPAPTTPSSANTPPAPARAPVGHGHDAVTGGSAGDHHLGTGASAGGHHLGTGASAGDHHLGTGGSAGPGLGPAFPYFRPTIEIDRRPVAPSDRPDQQTRLTAAIDRVCTRARDPHTTASQIKDALIEVVRDAEWIAGIETMIAAGTPALAATLDAGETLAAQFDAMPDATLKARAEDVRGAARAIALALIGQRDPSLNEAPDGAIIIAEDLNAWDVADADLSRIGGIVCRTGTPASHIAIMARACGIPAIFACATIPLVPAGTEIGLDGTTGAVFIQPQGPDRTRILAAKSAWQASQRDLLVWAPIQPTTKSGHAIQVAANLGSVKEIDAALKVGAMGVGLFRSELMFIEQRHPPSEQDQFEAYDTVATAFKDHPVIIRTLDIGGDKPIPGIDIPHENNPFLGWRGIRLCLDRPDLFKPQLRALLRAATNRNLKIMLPMIADPTEIERTHALIDQCRHELTAEHVAHDIPDLGIMIETPASVLLADQLAKQARFFSIGTNDLTQYIMAADRLNPSVMALNKPDHPAVLRAVELTCQAAIANKIPISVCGEAAASPSFIARLLPLGVRCLSMSPFAILTAKKCVSESAAL